MKANSWTEFQPLKEVILGKGFSADDITSEYFPDDELRSGLKRIFDETLDEKQRNIDELVREYKIKINSLTLS